MNERYERHMQLPEIGIKGQRKLNEASVLVVGAGGLGCPILQYLASCGVGKIGIMDFDTVSKTNLHRQILFSEDDLGKNKALCASHRLSQLNSEIDIETYPIAFTVNNGLSIIKKYDIIVDGTDNFVTRYLLNDASILLNKPLVFGALYKFEGQVSVFNYQNGPTYRCLFPDPPSKNDVPNCNEIGVLGVLPGIIGMFQALEVIKIITGVGEVLSGKLLHYNVLTHKQHTVNFKRKDEEISKIKAKNELERVATDDCLLVETISVEDIDFTKNPMFIDVRELHEVPGFQLKGMIKKPLSLLETENDFKEFQNNKIKIFFCQSGVRSKRAAQMMMEKGVENCFSLQQGAPILEDWLKIHV